jgi:Zn-dependent metalloprotease
LVKSLDVHYSSGVANHFFYLLAEGSGVGPYTDGAGSPTCDGSTLAGIGRDNAERIWYRALTTYMTSRTSYSGARTATLNAAQDLGFGTNSTEYQAVAAAWKAVNVVDSGGGQKGPK